MKKIIIYALTFSISMVMSNVQPIFAKTKEEPQESTTTETEATSYSYKLFDTLDKYEKELNNQMSRVYDVLNGNFQAENICPIPGVILTSYQNDAQITSSIYYVPQGICMTDDYIIVTAYHNPNLNGNKKEKDGYWSSVLYIIDINTHAFITTLTLPQAYHNGGIAFDGENIWFCGNTEPEYLENGQPFVQCMKYGRLQEIVTSSGLTGEILEKDVSEILYIDNKPSYLECDNGILWAGTYINNDPASNEGYVIGYPIEDMEGKSPSLNKLNVYRINGIPSSAQGMDIDGNYLYISSSGHGNENWVESSFVTKYDFSNMYKEKLIDFEGNYLKRIEVPKMNEEIIVDDESVYVIFESTAEAYLKGMPNGMKTDRILAIDKKLWE